jgi:putative transposase
MQYQFIESHQKDYCVEEMCECLDLGRSGYYAWSTRAPSERSVEDRQLKNRIQRWYELCDGRCGHRPIHKYLKDDDQLDCGRDWALRLMRELGLAGVQHKRFKPLGTNSNHGYGYCPNLLRAEGPPQRPDQVWVADTTYLRIHGGWCYLATVMDLCSRRIIGWSVSARNDSKLIEEALRCAMFTRGGQIPEGLMHHSDRGSTYASHSCAQMLRGLGIRQSMSAKGNCYDNAAMESFYGRYKTSSVRGRIFSSVDEARSNAFEYIEVFYNRFRKHSSLGYQSPVKFEQKFCPHGGKQTSLPACLNHN